jgi:tocopherol O-methyltransferase
VHFVRENQFNFFPRLAKRSGGVISPPSLKELVAYYESKTPAILQRYGPGPRLHYHTGLVDQPDCLDAPLEELRRRLIASQEDMLWHAARLWDARSRLCGEVLDVGCGLGGGAIFWAQEFGARVTAVTIAPSHIKLTEQFAERAGVKALVRPLLCDAAMVPGENCYDAAVAIDSSSSFRRAPWFRRVSKLLRPGGGAFIIDCFLERAEYREPFDRHWCAQIGTIDEYLAAAREAHLVLNLIEDVSARAVNFWTTTIALMRIEALDPRPSACPAASLEESLRIHALVRQGLLDRGLRHALLSFVKR